MLKYLLIILSLLIISCEDCPELDADIVLTDYYINEDNTHAWVDYYLVNTGEADIIKWSITFKVFYEDETQSFIGHTTNLFTNSIIVEPGDTSKVLTLRREINPIKVKNIIYSEIYLRQKESGCEYIRINEL